MAAGTSPAPETVTVDPGRGGASRWRMGALLELLGVSALAIAQPVLSSFADDPAHFLLRGADRLDIVVFTLAVLLGPAVLGWSVEVTVGVADPQLADRVHGLLMGCFAGAFVAVVLRAETSWSSAVVFGVAGAVALAVALVAVRPTVRTWARLLSVFTLWLLVWFLLLSPVGDLVRPGTRAAAAETASGDSVVFVVLDEFPLTTLLDARGEIDRDLFPGFARLADVSTWYRQATTTSDRTWLAVPAMLTGRMPTGLRVPSATAYPESLFTLLEQTHSLDVSELFAMCPARSCGASTGTGDRALDDLVADAWRLWTARLRPSEGVGFVADALDPGIGAREVDRFRAFVTAVGAANDPTAEPSVHFLHVLLPHARWQYLPDGRRYADPDPHLGLTDFDATLEGRWTDPSLAGLARQRHVLQTMYVDRLVGELLDRLANDLDHTAIVVTGDHGIAFDAGVPQRMIGVDNAIEVAHVPLFVHAPGQTTGRLDDRPVTHLDMLPTLAAQLDVDLDWDVDGVDLASADPDPANRVVVSQRGDGGLEQHPLDEVTTADLAAHRAVATAGVPPAWRQFASGSHDELLGTKVAAAPTRLVRLQARPATPDPSGDTVDAYRSFAVDVAPGSVVAAAVDGTIVGVRPAWAVSGGAEVAFVLPPTLVGSHEGTPMVELYEVR